MASPQPCYSSGAIQQLLDWLDGERLKAYDLSTSMAAQGNAHIKFISAKRVKERFTSDFNRVKDLIRATGVNQYEVFAQQLATRYCMVFCILTMIGKLEYIGKFAQHNNLWDARLPFAEEDPPKHFPQDPTDADFYKNFQAKQWQFCALELEAPTGLLVDDQRIIPLVRGEEIDMGGTAKVYKVEVHKEYDLLRGPHNEKHIYAIKTFRRKNAEGNGTKEAKAFQQVTDAGSRSTPGLIEFYGSFKHRETFNIVLEFADGGTLTKFFQMRDPPQSGEEIIAIWESVFETIKGLCAIHEQTPHGGAEHRRSSRNVLLQGWHQDIKPDNILAISTSDSSRYAWCFKLADLGLCHFKKIMADGPEAMDVDAFGTQQYGAPECYAATDFSQFRGNLLVARSVDIWSLGCVFSEVFVWIAKGWEGITKYRAIRKAAIENLPYWKGDELCFHDGSRLLAEVGGFLEFVRTELKPDDLAGGPILDAIYGMLSTDPRGRPSAASLERNTTILIQRAKDELKKRTPQTPPAPSTGSATVYSPLHDSYSPESSPVETRDGRSVSPPPPIWNLGRGIYSTAQVSDTNFSDFANRTPNEMTALAGSSTTSQSTPSSAYTQQRMPQVPRGSAVKPPRIHNHHVPHVEPSAISPNTNNNFDHPRYYNQYTQYPSHRLTPIPSWTSQQGGELPNDSTPPGATAREIESADQIAHVDSVEHSDVPRCSVEEAEEWYKEIKFRDNKKAQLPHHDQRGQLEDRDHVFMIDDSKTMQPHWRHVVNLVLHLAYIVKKLDTDGLDLFFLGSPSRYNFTSSRELANKIEQHGAKNYMTNLNLCLDRDLGAYALEIRKPTRRRSSLFRSITSPTSSSATSPRSPKPRSIYIFTDGILRGGDETQGYPAIRMITEELRAARASKGQLGIQLISFGEDPAGLARLRQLDQFNSGTLLDIVDTEPSTGNVWKMLLGSINPVYDRVDEIVIESTTSFSS